MKLAEIVDTLPAYAVDLQANFDALVTRAGRQDQVLRWGTLVAAAMVAGSPTVLRAVVTDASAVLLPDELEGARMAAAMMTLTNNFYRHRSLTLQPELKELRGGLRMAALRLRESSGATFKLWCVAVSVLNGCAACVQANEGAAIEDGATAEQIAGVLRVAALVKAIAVVVEAERAFKIPGAAADI